MAAPVESGLNVYSVTLVGNAVTVVALSYTGVSAQDTGTGSDSLSILGDTNTATSQDQFSASQGVDEVAGYYFGVATINGVTGFIASETPNSGPFFFLTPSSTTLFTGDTGVASLDTDGGSSTADKWDVSTGAPTAVCFMAGTRIATPNGERAVERLEAGDMVLTVEGEPRPVRWLGRQTVSRLFADPAKVTPVRIRRGALGAGLPQRDLVVSPGHALRLDGVLAEAGALVNGVTIIRDAAAPAIFAYYHVELDDHALILAEGVAAETFIDNLDRMAFDNWDQRQPLAGSAIAEMDLPRAKSSRQLPRGLRERLAAAAIVTSPATAA